MKNEKIGVILLAGGVGSRMQSTIPKQFLPLKGKPIARHSFDVFLQLPQITEIVVVCAPDYRHLFNSSNTEIPVSFALPGDLRQDSVFNGLQAITTDCSYICVHDSARPGITQKMVHRAIDSALIHGAATVGMPIKFTVKTSDQQGFVEHTPDRSTIWEIQTPQVVRKDWLHEGFAYAKKHHIQVTDDVSLAEILKYPVKLVPGSYSNIKITTSEDLLFAEQLLD